MTIPKSKFLDVAGRPLTQGLFLEIGYGDYSVYTLKDEDHEHKGTLYPSLKKLYLEEEDPAEYGFVTKHLLNWRQWLRLYENKLLKPHIDEWRNELELKLLSRATAQMIKSAAGGKVNAIQWVATKGWEERAAGRPSKAETEKHLKIAESIDNEYSADVIRLNTGT